MNIRLTILLVFVLVLFGGSFLWFQFNQKEEDTPDQPWLFKVDDDSIVHIEVTHNGQTGTYDKKAGGTTWYIQDGGQETPVFLEKWSGTPLLLSGPQVRRVVAQTIDDPAKYGLEPPGTVVKVTERSGLTYEFHMGDPTPDGENQYAYLVGDPQLFTVPQIWAEVINRLATEPPYSRLYYVDADNSFIGIEVNHSGQSVGYESRRGGREWIAITDTEIPVAPEKWQNILPSLSEPPVAEVRANKIDRPEQYGLDEPKTTVEIFTRNERPFVFFLGSPTEDGENRYAQRRGRTELFTVPESWARMLEGLVTEPPYSSDQATSGTG